MRTVRTILILLAAFLAVLACKKTPQSIEEPDPDPAPTSITLSESSFTVAQGGEEITLTVTSPAQPQISVPDWITLVEGVYKNYQVIVILRVGANISFNPREADVTVSSSNASAVSLKISQSALKRPETGTPPEGWEKASDTAKNMGAGWNLGNTLDSNSGDVNNMWIEAYSSRNPSDYETAWGQPVATQKLIHMFKDAGFNAIRVPVTWYPHMGTITVSGTQWDKSSWTGFDVDPAWMARVKEVVDYVISEGMYCILNVHHDTGEYSTSWLRADKAVYKSVYDRYSALWTQIATEFQSYGPQLVFESFNEMLDTKGTWNYSSADAHETINMYNADFVTTVRATGGNNVWRNLILNTYGASCQPQALSDFRVPEDIVEGHLMAEVHSYAPYHFAFDTDSPQTVFDASCESEIKGLVENMNNYLVKKGIPCVLGEYGCTASRTETEMAKQAACYVAAATRYSIPCFYWMGLSDGADRSVPKWTMPEIKDAILKAYRDNRN